MKRLVSNNTAEIFNSIKSSAIIIANNDLLLLWSGKPLTVDYETYCHLVLNLKQWLSPTAYRISLGLELLEAEKDNGNNQLDAIIHAFEHNIEDESGGGDPTRSHAKLFVDSCEHVCQALFNKPLDLSKGEVIDGTKSLHSGSIELFNSNIYRMLGAAVAQETHALPQLENMYKGLLTVRHLFGDSAWKQATDFYDIHLDGTEARHSEDLNKTIWAIIDTDEKMNEFIQGSQIFLGLLDNYWSKLYSSTCQ